MADQTQSEESLLKQLREDFRYHKEYWRENYEEAEKDMNCAAAIPPAEFTEDRKGRPCIWPDETSQYIKQANNNLRQNKRSIKISPRSDDADAKDAEHRQAYIRGIEYASKAQSIYTTAFESAAQCGFGFWRITTKVTGPNGEQEPRLKRIPNWATVYPDPDAREADFSDQNSCFVLDSMRDTTFAARYPKAKKSSFTPADISEAPDWFHGDNIVVAEWWKRKPLDDDEHRFKVTQRITNGLEFLEVNEWIGSWIPIVGTYGEELYVRSAGQSKRMFLSLIRRARAPQQMLAYVASQEAEEFGMMPRAALQGYKGMFDPEVHKYIHKIPTAYIEFGIPSDWQAGWGVPPLPTRAQFTPNPQAYEMSYERWRRAIQAAMGISPLPTAAQRQNEKSGVALEKIQNEQAIGAFHITDNFVRSLENTGRQLNELITELAKLDSLPAQVLGKDQKDEDQILKVAGSGQSIDRDAASEHLDEADQFFAHRGQFEVTVSDGPNYLSQREEASAFADTLLQSLPAMGITGPLMQQILAIAVKLKNIGTFGDEIADLLSPPDPNKLPPQAKAIMAQAQQQIHGLTQELQKLQMEKLGKVTEIQGKKELALMDHVSTMAEADKDRETKLAVAEVMTKAQSISERLDMVHDLIKQFHDQAHDLASQNLQQQHEKSIADQQAANASMQSAQDAQQNQAAQEAAPAQ